MRFDSQLTIAIASPKEPPEREDIRCVLEMIKFDPMQDHGFSSQLIRI
jgi:hypothetical protein